MSQQNGSRSFAYRHEFNFGPDDTGFRVRQTISVDFVPRNAGLGEGSGQSVDGNENQNTPTISGSVASRSQSASHRSGTSHHSSNGTPENNLALIRRARDRPRQVAARRSTFQGGTQPVRPSSHFSEVRRAGGLGSGRNSHQSHSSSSRHTRSRARTVTSESSIDEPLINGYPDRVQQARGERGALPQAATVPQQPSGTRLVAKTHPTRANHKGVGWTLDEEKLLVHGLVAGKTIGTIREESLARRTKNACQLRIQHLQVRNKISGSKKDGYRILDPILQ